MSTLARRLAKLEARQVSAVPAAETIRVKFVAPHTMAVVGTLVMTLEPRGIPERLCGGDTDDEVTKGEWDALFAPHLAGCVAR